MKEHFFETLEYAAEAASMYGGSIQVDVRVNGKLITLFVVYQNDQVFLRGKSGHVVVQWFGNTFSLKSSSDETTHIPLTRVREARVSDSDQAPHLTVE
ncbi:MAG: hypothetical protein O3B64_03310 [bacterium]|nr:hypothetical protein [bacterium]